jgi:hypothetical protein
MNKNIAIIAGVVVAVTVPVLGFAAGIDPCPLGSNTLKCPGAGASFFIANILIGGAKLAFGGVLFAMLIWYGMKLIMGADNDSTITEVYNSYTYAVIGTILAGGAFALANTFALEGIIMNQAPTNEILLGVRIALRAILGTALLFNIFYQGYRLISSQDDSQVEKSKKQFIYGMVGAGIVILADVLVTAFIGSDSQLINTHIIGIANFIGTILGAFAVIALFIAGLWLVFAVNEQNKDKAKKIIITTFIVLAVSMVSLALIRFTVDAPGI